MMERSSRCLAVSTPSNKTQHACLNCHFHVHDIVFQMLQRQPCGRQKHDARILRLSGGRPLGVVVGAARNAESSVTKAVTPKVRRWRVVPKVLRLPMPTLTLQQQRPWPQQKSMATTKTMTTTTTMTTTKLRRTQAAMMVESM